MPPATRAVERLCRDGRRALWTGLRQVGSDRPLAGIGRAVGDFARRNGYTLVRNLASHGVGAALHEVPTEIATWPDAAERRLMREGMVLTVASRSCRSAPSSPRTATGRGRSTRPRALTVQYEHTVVATRNGPLVLTMPGR